MERDSFEPIVAIGKDRTSVSAFAYKAVREYAQTLYDIADGKLDAVPMITSVVAPEGVAQAFSTLATPGARGQDHDQFRGAGRRILAVGQGLGDQGSRQRVSGRGGNRPGCSATGR